MNLEVVSPWVNFYREIETLFQEDPQITIKYDEKQNAINLYVSDNTKAEALAKIMPTSKEFGNVTLGINIIPPNQNDDSFLSNFRRAFEGNPIVNEIKGIDTVYGHFDYVMFENEVVQYFNDNLQDPRGLRSTIYQDIAKDVFSDQNEVFFCTQISEG